MARMVSGMGEAQQTPYARAEVEKPVSLEERIAGAEAVMAQVQEVERIKARLVRVKQFNKCVAINADLCAVVRALAKLQASGAIQIGQYHEN